MTLPYATMCAMWADEMWAARSFRHTYQPHAACSSARYWASQSLGARIRAWMLDDLIMLHQTHIHEGRRHHA